MTADLVVTALRERVRQDMELEARARAVYAPRELWVLCEEWNRRAGTWEQAPDMDGSISGWRAESAQDPELLDALDALVRGDVATAVVGGGAAPMYRLRLRGGR